MRVENSFIPVDGVGPATERKLWEAGVTHWDDFAGDVVGPTRADRIDAWIAEADDHLGAGDAAYFERCFPSHSRWRLYENFRDEACFLDIETTGLDHRRDDVTVVSLVLGGETTTLVRGRDLTVDRLAAVLDRASLLLSFNGVQFDVPFLERAFGVSIDLPHLDLRYPCRRLDLTGGLKAIERAVGIDRDRPDLSGRDAVRLWHRYERGNSGALETLVDYNRADTENLRPLADLVTARLHDHTAGDIPL